MVKLNILTKKQRLIIFGSILGDSYLQKIGNNNSRLRIEHSTKQLEYISWKRLELSNLFHKNPVLCKERNTYRIQSQSSRTLGVFRKRFYDENNCKIIPKNIKFIAEPIVMAIWYMDGGYYNEGCKYMEIYMPKSFGDQNLVDFINTSTDVEWVLKIKNNHSKLVLYKNCQIIKFSKYISNWVIPSMRYKLHSDIR